MNDTVSEDVKLDEAAYELAVAAFFDANNKIQQCADCGGAGRHPDESECSACKGGGFIAPEGWDPYASLIRAYLAATKPPLAGEVTDETVERLAAYLCDEHDDEFSPRRNASWPEDENDDGKREGGYVAIQPKHVQARAREIARRILAFTRTASPPMPGRGEGQ